jgi:uncharacterized caspase-like protein
MSTSVQFSLKRRLVAAIFACAVSLGAIGAATAGPVLSQSETPSLRSTRLADAAPTAEPTSSSPSANIGNPAPVVGTEKRVALVIGNSAYENVTALPNPANDAKAIGQFLNSAGFEVIQATDLDHDEMIKVLQDFSAKISERGPNTVAFVYYAGHGLQIAGDNYLIPIDAKITTEADVPNAAVRLVDVMATLQAVPSRMRIVVLDACRNNPFSQLKDTGRGLAIVDAPNGSIVGYSTAPGTEAFDGEGKNSPYTSAFLRLGREPNLPIEQFFKKVRVVVNDVTEGKQTPWESSSLTSDFYFFGDTAIAAAKTVDPVLSANASAARPTMVASNIRSRTPREAYNYAVAEDRPDAYEEFVRVYPYDPFAAEIRRLLAAKLLAAAWHGAVLANSPMAYKDFYAKYSDSPYANVALKLESQPKILPLYQPTKIMVAPQIVPQVKLTNFNGVSVPQGANAPIGLGNNGSLFNRTKTLLNAPLQQGLGGQNLGLPGKGLPGMNQNSNPTANNGLGISLPNNSQAAKTSPLGIDLAKDSKRIDTKIDANRVTTLPQANKLPANNGPIGDVMKRDGKILNGNINAGNGVTGVSNGNQASGTTYRDRRIERARINNMPAAQQMPQKPPVMQATSVKRFQPGQRFTTGGSNGGNASGMQFRGTRNTSLGSGAGGGGRFASGGTSFGRSFR